MLLCKYFQIVFRAALSAYSGVIYIYFITDTEETFEPDMYERDLVPPQLHRN